MGGFLFCFGGWGGRILQTLQRVFIANCRVGAYVVITAVEGEQVGSAGAAVWASQVPTWNTYTAAPDRPRFRIIFLSRRTRELAMASPVIEIPSTHNDVLCAGMVVVVSRQLPYTYKAYRCAFSVPSSCCRMERDRSGILPGQEHSC
jgi:hypothetical protein